MRLLALVLLPWLLAAQFFPYPGPGRRDTTGGGGGPFTDGFDGGPGLSASWTVISGTWSVSGSTARPSTGDNDGAVAVVTGHTFANDQYAEATLDTDGISAFQSWEVVVRADSMGNSGYGFAVNLSNAALVDFSDGSTLQACTFTPNPNDVIRIEAEGTTIRALANGTPISGCTTTNADYSSGIAGMQIFRAEADDGTHFLDFEAGDL